MKKTITIFLSLFLIGAQSFAQCVPTNDFSGSTLAVSASALTPVYACADCGDHVRVLSIQTFADTTLTVVVDPDQPALNVTVFADRFRLDSIAGLPDGLTYTTNSAYDTTYDAVENPFGYWINPGDTVSGFENSIGCISIEGTAAAWTAAVGGGPNNDGAYPLTIYIDARAADFLPVEIAGVVGYNTWLTDMGFLLDAFGDPNFTPNGIRLQDAATLQVFASGVGVEEIEGGTFSVYPNPAQDYLEISIADMEQESVELRVNDVKGRLVGKHSITGVSNYRFDTTALEAGVYTISVVSNNRTATQKFVIQ